MSIETTGLFKGNTFKTSQASLAGGFVKNDAGGLFSYDEGPPAAAPDGSIWDFIQTKTIGASTNSVVFTGLNGDVDDVYKLVYSGIDYPGVTTNFQVRPNGIVPTGTDFVAQAMLFTTVPVANPTFTFTYWPLINEGNIYLSGRVYITAKTGVPRTFTTMSQASSRTLAPLTNLWATGFWTDTTTNITSLEIFTPSGNGITAGSVWSLWRVNR